MKVGQNQVHMHIQELSVQSIVELFKSSTGRITCPVCGKESIRFLASKGHNPLFVGKDPDEHGDHVHAYAGEIGCKAVEKYHPEVVKDSDEYFRLAGEYYVQVGFTKKGTITSLGHKAAQALNKLLERQHRWR